MCIVGTYHMNKRCPKCGGIVAMVPSRRAYGFWCGECGTYWNILEDDLAAMCVKWWKDKHGQAEPVQQ